VLYAESMFPPMEMLEEEDKKRKQFIYGEINLNAELLKKSRDKAPDSDEHSKLILRREELQKELGIWETAITSKP